MRRLTSTFTRPWFGRGPRACIGVECGWMAPPPALTAPLPTPMAPRCPTGLPDVVGALAPWRSNPPLPRFVTLGAVKKQEYQWAGEVSFRPGFSRWPRTPPAATPCRAPLEARPYYHNSRANPSHAKNRDDGPKGGRKVFRSVRFLRSWSLACFRSSPPSSPWWTGRAGRGNHAAAAPGDGRAGSWRYQPGRQRLLPGGPRSWRLPAGSPSSTLCANYPGAWTAVSKVEKPWAQHVRVAL